jgi:hypothetical protein
MSGFVKRKYRQEEAVKTFHTLAKKTNGSEKGAALKNWRLARKSLQSSKKEKRRAKAEEEYHRFVTQNAAWKKKLLKVRRKTSRTTQANKKKAKKPQKPKNSTVSPKAYKKKVKTRVSL